MSIESTDRNKYKENNFRRRFCHKPKPLNVPIQELLMHKLNFTSIVIDYAFQNKAVAGWVLFSLQKGSKWAHSGDKCGLNRPQRYMLDYDILNKRFKGHKAHQSFGLELLSHLSSHFYRLIKIYIWKLPNLTVFGVETKYTPIFHILVAKAPKMDNVHRIFCFFMVLWLPWKPIKLSSLQKKQAW